MIQLLTDEQLKKLDDEAFSLLKRNTIFSHSRAPYDVAYCIVYGQADKFGQALVVELTEENIVKVLSGEKPSVHMVTRDQLRCINILRPNPRLRELRETPTAHTDDSSAT